MSWPLAQRSRRSGFSRCDRDCALLFLDPPYWGVEGDYGPIFSADDWGRLGAGLRRLKRRVILTVNDKPETRALFAAHTIETVDTTYSISRDKRAAKKPRAELIVTAAR